MNKQALHSALFTIWSLVLGSTQTPLTGQQERKLDDAITMVENEWDKNDPMIQKARFVCECARRHLAAITALPQRKSNGWRTLLEDCEALQRDLGSSN